MKILPLNCDNSIVISTAVRETEGKSDCAFHLSFPHDSFFSTAIFFISIRHTKISKYWELLGSHLPSNLFSANQGKAGILRDFFWYFTLRDSLNALCCHFVTERSANHGLRSGPGQFVLNPTRKDVPKQTHPPLNNDHNRSVSEQMTRSFGYGNHSNLAEKIISSFPWQGCIGLLVHLPVHALLAETSVALIELAT